MASSPPASAAPSKASQPPPGKTPSAAPSKAPSAGKGGPPPPGKGGPPPPKGGKGAPEPKKSIAATKKKSIFQPIIEDEPEPQKHPWPKAFCVIIYPFAVMFIGLFQVVLGVSILVASAALITHNVRPLPRGGTPDYDEDYKLGYKRAMIAGMVIGPILAGVGVVTFLAGLLKKRTIALVAVIAKIVNWMVILLYVMYYLSTGIYIFAPGLFLFLFLWGTDVYFCYVVWDFYRVVEVMALHDNPVEVKEFTPEPEVPKPQKHKYEMHHVAGTDQEEVQAKKKGRKSVKVTPFIPKPDKNAPKGPPSTPSNAGSTADGPPKKKKKQAQAEEV